MVASYASSSATAKERMTTNIIFVGAIPINESLYASKLFIHVCLPHWTAL